MAWLDPDGPDPDALIAAGLRFTVDRQVARVTLDGPENRNAQSPAMWRALAGIGGALPPQVRVVVLDAVGPSFSSGLDRRMFAPGGIAGEPSMVDLAGFDDDRLDATLAEYQSAFAWWRDSPAVSICAVQGHAVGAGFQLALACDLIVCADDAQFAIREPSLGLVPDLGGTAALVEAVGYRRAMEICATGRWVSAVEAVGSGLAVVSVPAKDLAGAVDDLVAAILSHSADAVGATKRLLARAADRDRAGQWAAERSAQAGRLRDIVAEAAPDR